MRSDALVELDTLVLDCRDERAAAYIAEAVGSYRAGAFRAAVVTTWVAVVFDFIHKLGELEMTGDKRAITILEAFRKCQVAGDVKASWEFERQVPHKALDLELITPNEQKDLLRLLEDRNRCAHPALNSEQEAYAPSAELARLHIRNAVLYLLQHQPVQGAAALNRLKGEVASDYFPTRVNEAVEHFRRGPLSRPRVSLVRNFALANLKHLLGPELVPNTALRFIAALGAVREMHRERVEDVLQQNLSVLARSAISDERQRAVLRLLRGLTDLWLFLEKDVRATLSRYVRAVPTKALLDVSIALDCAELRGDALHRIENATEEELSAVVAKKPREDYVDRALSFYSQSESFDEANKRATSLVLPLVSTMKVEHLKAIIEACGSNDELRHSFRRKQIVDALRQQELMPPADFDQLLMKNRLHDGAQEA